MKLGHIIISAALWAAATPCAFAVVATGGNTTSVIDGYRIHTFTNSATASTFVVTAGGNVEVLVVAGGGGGGETIGGGGGGGGVIFSNAYTVIADTYMVLVGQGGAGGWDGGGTYPPGAKGSNSVFGGLIAIGGGAGAGYNVNAVGTGGSAGGNGGGGGTRADYTPGQGNDGGAHLGNNAAGGGGGANEKGSNGTAISGGKGGDGRAFNISGVTVYYGGGGGGGTRNTTGPGPGAGGAGGGGSGGRTTAGERGLNRTGGGGGGGGYVADLAGGAGGSGIVIVRYLLGIDNASGATNVVATNAWLNGMLYADMPNAAVYVFWGPTDGGQDASAWANTNVWAAPRTPGSFTFQATDLASDATWHYRYAVSNETGWTWALDTSVFITGDVWIGKTADASEIGPTPGTFTVHRVASATTEALVVNYTVGGTATPGVDYTALSGMVTIPKGEETATIEVNPYLDHLLEGTETVTVTVVSGPYMIGSPSNAALDIADAGMVMLTWGGGGNNGLASNPDNWTGGVLPIAGDGVILDATTNKSMTWDLDVELGAWYQVAYSGTVTVATRYGSTGFTNLVILGDCVISNGVWTHTQNSGTEVSRIRVTIGGELIVGSNAAINATGAGYRNSQGPGGTATSGSSGGTHGGRGANTYVHNKIGRNTYGSVTRPVNLGSGGSSGRGGGAILLNVAGRALIDGTVTAKGNDVANYAGSGGSVWLTAGKIVGTGVINADGAHQIGGGFARGGGGRAAVWLTDEDADFSGYAGVISAYGGAVTDASGNISGSSGGPGTVYLQAGSDTLGRGELIVDNGGRATYSAWFQDGCAGLGDLETATYEFKRITLRNNGRLNICSNNTLIVTNTIIQGDASLAGLVIEGGTVEAPDLFVCSNYFICIRNVGVTANFSPQILTLGTNGIFYVDQPHALAGQLIIAPGGKLTHSHNLWFDAAYGQKLLPAESLNRLILSIDSNVTVQSGGLIDVSGRGYPGPEGPGRTDNDTYGGSYGGLGGGMSGKSVCYGSITQPASLGTGGNSAGLVGGGAMLLTVTGIVSNDGTICADGNNAANYAGSGGTISIEAGSFLGTGTIRAAGGSLTGNGTGPGGGGRVTLRVTDAGNDFSSYAGPIQAFSGRRSGTAHYAGAGTVYLRTASQGEDEGVLIVDNGGVANTGFTEIGADVTDSTMGQVLIRQSGSLLLATNQTMTVSDVWSNTAAFTGYSDSAVIFAGGQGSTGMIYGSTLFAGLVCTTPGKTLFFEAGSTNAVGALGQLWLQGDEAAPVTLRASGTGTWMLSADASANLSITHVDVADSDASGGAEIVALNSVNSGGNTNWRFPTATVGDIITWTGDDTLWSSAANWDLNRYPIETDVIVIPGGLARYPVLGGLVAANRLTVAVGASLALNGYDLTVTNQLVVAGTLTASGTETLTLTKDADFTGGSIVPAFSTLVLAGEGAQSINSAGLTFYKVRVDNETGSVSFIGGFSATELRCEAPSGTRSLRFEAGKTAVLRDFVMRGASPGATNITLNSTAAGQKWKLAVSGYRSVSEVDVHDSDASAGLPIFALNSKDSGGNVNWQFGAAPTVWLGTSGNNFFTAANWSPAVVPGPTTRVLVESGPVMTITGAVTMLDLTVGGGSEVITVTANAPVTVRETITILSNGIVTLNRPSIASNGVSVRANGVLTHSANTSAEVNKLDLTVYGDTEIDPAGVIDATGKGYAAGYGPGSAAGAWVQGSYGGRATGPCYGSILTPTNLGSGGWSGQSGIGGGAVALRVAGALRNDGLVCADGVLGGYNTAGSGGSVYLVSDTLTGVGAIRANGGLGSSAGGGRISLVLTNENADFSGFMGTVQVYSGVVLPAAVNANNGGAGTIYRQTTADRPGRGTVWIGNNGFLNTGYTDVPAFTNGVAGEANRAIFRVADKSKLRLTDDFTVGDIWLDTGDAWLDLGSNTLTVNARKHPLGLVTNILNRGEIVWMGLPPGVLIIVK